MAVVITRTPWIDDDGTGTTGTVLNNAMKTGLYNEIDTALAKVAQLAGGNTFTGNQAITGLLTVTGLGAHTFTGTGGGPIDLMVRNTSAGAGNQTRLAVGNDTDAYLTFLASFSSTFTATGFQFPGGSLLFAGGGGGLSIYSGTAIRLYAGGPERMRIATTGEVLINTVTTGLGQLAIVTDGAVHYGITIQNSNPGNAINYLFFTNSAGAVAGNIAQSGATGVSYGTTSDARLKHDGGPARDLTALRGVLVHDFTWHADGVRDRGVFAQEAHALYPRAIVPGTDDTTDDGVTLARPWMIDYSKFVPDLIVGWQQHDAALADLRALLATLKGFPNA